MEYIIGIAVISKTIGLHIDVLLDDMIKVSLSENCPIKTDLLSNYFDFLGFGITIIVLIGMCVCALPTYMRNNLWAAIIVVLQW